MKRRGVTVLAGFVLAVLLVAGISLARVPYVVMSAGPTVNTLTAVDADGDECTVGAKGCQEVIQIAKTSTSDSDGQLRLVTVNVQSRTGLLDVIKGWFSDEQAVVPYEFVYPPDRTKDQVEQQNQEDFKESQTSAETAALRKLGYPVRVSVGEVTAGGASDGKLKKGDVIESVDGTKIESPSQLVELIKAKPVGTVLKFQVTRDGKAEAVEVATKPASATDQTPRINIEVATVQPHPFDLSIKLDDIGGPSAGLMFALGIMDKLTPEDLTGGKIIAGTGTIDDAGNVGPIGGVPQKLYGAKKAGAKVFLTPADNCAEAKANALDGLPLIKVATLDDALNALATLRAGGQPPTC
ncbi:PDZ domain-containing protein [Catellatospora sp. KI3]|uniref:YlbL family protein n=1 Tax=Catellatospora sp. KI3 TaxID=3041620 RepID=UPI002482A945|nr:PDZ domain-containing protein [Catellatospora sp. KI3]MDI1459832.1 PDZ domain-containing protein [Catellatospora sp. KI3]